MTRIAMGLGQVPGGGGISPKGVLSAGDRSHVVGSHAGAVVAHKVVEDQFDRYRAVHSLPVHLHGLGGLVAVPRLVVGGSHTGESVAVPVDVLLPDPASREKIFDEVGLARVVAVDEAAWLALDSAKVDVVVVPDSRVLTTPAGAFVMGRHGMKTVPEVLDVA